MGREQQTPASPQSGQVQGTPPSVLPPELLLDPPEELLEPPLEEDEPPLDDDDPPLDEEEPPLEDPLPDPPPLELELLVSAHSLEQCRIAHVISLSPVVRSAAEQPHAPAQRDIVFPRSRHPMYVSHPVNCAQAHHSASQWFAMQSLHFWLSVSGVHEAASLPPPLDEPLASPPELPPEDEPVDASLPLPDEKAEPPQSETAAAGTSTRRRAEARMSRSITKPA